MTRHKRLKYYSGMCAVYDAREEFTHEQVLDNETVLRGDPENNFWGQFGPHGTMTWFGNAPSQWDKSKAVEKDYTRNLELEIDVS